jgi:5-methylcytosine-specific restriction protein A
VNRALRKLENTVNKMEALEGEEYKREARFRQRNRALIEAKKANSNYCCEVCGFNFGETYGPVGEGFIVAHHEEPLGGRRGASRTSLEDIRLVCGNCHAMIHREGTPLLIEKLRAKLSKSG